MKKRAGARPAGVKSAKKSAKKKVSRMAAGSRSAAAGRRKKAAPRPAAAPPSHDEMMAMWSRAMTPGDGHRRLEPLIGTFHARTTFLMEPNAPPSVSEGVSENRWVLGGRYLEQTYKGSSMGMPFEGLGYTGFDNAQGKYVGTWMDTFGTGLMNSVGTGRPTDRKLTSRAEAVDPSGRVINFECIVEIQDQDHHTWEMWTRAPSGKRYRAMQAEYTRK